MDSSDAALPDVPSPALVWRNGPANLGLNGNAVHVWRIPLSVSSDRMDALKILLSSDETCRIERARSQQVKRRFLISRGILRELLARYLGTEPAEIKFKYNAHGKPSLDDEHASWSLKFNLSHSGDLALVAVAVGRDIGVDVEYCRAGSVGDRMRVARRYFSTSEYAFLDRLPVEDRVDSFYRLWTCKEAFIKATGLGLTVPLSSFDIDLEDSIRPVLVADEGGGNTNQWILQHLVPGEGYAGAVAVNGRDLSVSCWQWSTYALAERRPLL